MKREYEELEICSLGQSNDSVAGCYPIDNPPFLIVRDNKNNYYLVRDSEILTYEKCRYMGVINEDYKIAKEIRKFVNVKKRRPY